MTSQEGSSGSSAGFKQHRVFAGWYPGRAAAMDRGGFAEYRRALLAGLEGEVLEVGAGSGLNFPYYPAEVTRVVAVEPEANLREKARAATAQAPVPIEVVDGVAEDLSAHAGRFDAAVCSLVLCSVADQRKALEQMRLALRARDDGDVGEVRVLEHVRSQTSGLRRVQRILDATVLWRQIGAGCHVARDVTEAVEPAGLAVKSLERFRFPAKPPLPTSPHVLLITVPERRSTARF